MKKVHKCVIHKKNIEIKCRSELSVYFENSLDKIVVVIGLNPSKADEDTSDKTIDILKTFFREQKIYSKLIVYNLFECYSTDSRCIVKETVTDFSTDEKSKIFEIAESIVIAWGTGDFKKEKKDAVSILKQYEDKLYCLTSNGQRKPYHPSRLSKKFSLVKISAEECIPK